MILSAIYIPKKSLTHLFGVEHNGQTINLGGKHFYDFLESDNGQLVVSHSDNLESINDFWGKNISLISAFVGANGSGKTSILRTLVREFASNPKLRNCVLVYEDKESIHILNESDMPLVESDNFKVIERADLKEKFLYYSPNLDYDLVDGQYDISLVNYHTKNLSNFYLGNIKRHLLFLKNESLINALKENYEDFPLYDKVKFTAKTLYKSDFEKQYIQSTLGNKLYKVRNLLLDKIDRTVEETITLTKEDIEQIFERNGTIQDELKELWTTYINKASDRQQYISGGINFLNDVEINILSYLVLEDTFSLDGDYGFYPLSKILNAQSFEEKLTHFLHKFIIQASESVYNAITNKLNISFDNLDEIRDVVSRISSPKMFYRGIDYEAKAKNVNKQIDLIESVYEFYTRLISLMQKDYCTEFTGGFEVDIVNADISEFNGLVDCYEEMLTKFYWGNLGGVLEIRSNIKLSTGEKSILNMYSSIYDYLKRYSATHMYNENCVLLLDEPDQGYHPLWKKRFINALTSTLPRLFEINPFIKHLQVVFTTHAPLTLSDIPKHNIVYLEKNKRGKTIINSKNSRKSFGANINDLLADSFFIKGSLMGDFAESKIEATIKWINKIKNHPNDIPVDKLEYHKKVISVIEEPIIRFKLSEMLQEVLGQNSAFQKEMIDKEIRYLRDKLDNL